MGSSAMQQSSRRRHTRAGLAQALPGSLLAILLMVSGYVGADAGDSRSLAHLMQEVSDMLRTRAQEAHPDAEIGVEIQPLDSRLQLTPCTDVDMTPRGERVHGRIPVALRCHAPQSWSIFMTGDVTVALPVVVTRHPIRRGEILSANRLNVERQDLTGLRNLYYTSISAVAGKQAKRNFAAGSVVFASQLKDPLAVARGQRVQIIARHGAVEISSRGEALEPGSVGEQIRVRNLQSERVVFAWVDGPGRVVTSRQEPAGASSQGE